MVSGSIDDCGIFNLPCISQRAGRITSIEPRKEVPFDIHRIYYLYDVPSGADRGGHAHKRLHQLIVAASGSFTIVLDDGLNKKKIDLNRPQFGLLIVPGIWRELVNFSSGAVCLVLASLKYEADDYIRDYNAFLAFRGIG